MSATPQVNSPHADHSHVNPWIVAISVMCCTFMEVLDTTVVNVSLPHIAGNLSATIEEATWVLTSYLVANAVILPITGWLSNHFGRKRLLMFSVVGFTASSFLCGAAPTLPLLIVFRLLQGACGGSLAPLSQAVLLEAFPPEARGKAMGFWGLGIVVAPVLGPVLGGWLTDSYSWRWVFYINLPVGILSIFMVQMFVFDPPYIRRSEAGVDWWGIGMLTVWIGALQVAFDKGQELDWFSSRFIVILVAIAIVFLIAFVVRELMAEHPVMNMNVFRLRSYSAGVFLMTTLGFVLYGSIVLLPIWLQTLLGYPATTTGFTMAPRGLGSMIGMPLVGIFVSRFDPRKVLAGGLLMGAASTWRLSQLNLDAGFWDLFWPQAIQGFGLGMVFVPLTTIAMNPVPREAMGNATSIYNLMRNLGGSVGIAIIAMLNTRFQQKYIAILGSNVTATNPEATQRLAAMRSMFLGMGSGQALAERRAYASIFGVVQRQAAMRAFVDLFQLITIVFLLMIPLTLIMRKPKGSGGGARAAGR
ncbi:MAG TPA: DHA2 family efflux MFS transporter permease subunit [Bryobacteraceae bacterium]|nr:DHA2 family efflux MFS transporter permease subunit [Bryobacteraceae bacterium]